MNGSMGWSKEVEMGGEVIASAISAATRWRGWEDDRTDVSWWGGEVGLRRTAIEYDILIADYSFDVSMNAATSRMMMICVLKYPDAQCTLPILLSMQYFSKKQQNTRKNR